MTKPPESAPHYEAEAVPGGEIELRRPWQRALFIVGLALLVLVAIGLGIAGFA